MSDEPATADDGGSSTERVLDAETAGRVAALKIAAARAVDGLLSGMHKSPHRGASVVFVEHREYRPGDDPRLLDWRAFARSDRHTIKRFEQESQLGTMLVLDGSGSMDFAGSTGPKKIEHAATLLAAVATILAGQGDAVGVLRFDHAVGTEQRPRSGATAFDRVLRELAVPARTAPSGAAAGKATALAEALERLADTATRRGLIVIASDLWVEPAAGEADPLVALDRLRARGHEVWVAQVMTREELELPHADAARFLGCEGEPSLEADPVVLREAYLEGMRAFLEDRAQRVISAGGRYLLARTDEPAHQLLARLIAQRGRARWA